MSATIPEGVLVYGTPSVELLLGSFANTETNGTVTLRGRSLGLASSNIKSVRMGQFPCVDVVMAVQDDPLENEQSITCTVMGGVGRDLDVQMVLREGGSAMHAGVFNFLPPTLSSITPDSSRFGNIFVDFVLFGSDFSASRYGILPSDIKVGGASCGAVVLYNATALGCNNVSALSFSQSSVSVTIGGQTTTTAIFTPEGAPRID